MFFWYNGLVVKERGEKIMNRNEIFEVQDFINWTSQKIELHHRNSSVSKRILYRGQVYECELGIGIGSEQRKKRPVVIIQNNRSNEKSPNTIISPITHTLTSAPISTKYDSDGKLILDGYVMTGNIVTVSKARLGNKISNLTLSEMKIVEDEIIKSQGMKKRFDTLTNIISDKDTYIEKLKEKNTVQEELLEQLKINIDEQKRAIEELKKSSITEVG